jgi:hypothetical protein
MSFEERPSVAVILSIIGGVLMLVGGSMAFMMLSYNSGFGMMSGFGGMMGDYSDMMDGVNLPCATLGGLMLLSLVSGILVIVGAVMMDIHPSQSRTWGIIVLVFSIVSFVGMGGFLIGAVLGVVGGAMALGWKAKPRV